MERNKTRSLDSIFQRVLLLRLFLPFLALTLLVVGLETYQESNTLEARQLQVARSMARTVHDYLDQAGHEMATIAQVAEISTSDELTRYMQVTWRVHEYFDTLYRLDATGAISVLVPSDQRYRGLDMSQQSYFKEAGQSASVSMSQPFTSLRTGQPTVYMTQSLSDGGMVVGELNLNALQEAVVVEHSESDQNLIFITDQTGTLLAHPQSDMVAQQANVGDMEIVQRGLTGAAILNYLTAEGLVVGSAAPMEQTGWVIVAQMPLFTAYASQMGTAVLTLLMAPFIWLTIVWSLKTQLRRYVMTPLTRLGQGADALAVGDFHRGEALVTSLSETIEIRTLGANFHHMSQAIQSRQAALKESEKNYLNTQKFAQIGSWDLEIATKEVVWSDEVYRIFGLDKQQFSPNLEKVIERIHPEDRESVMKVVGATIQSRKPGAFERRLIRPDGEIRHFVTHLEIVFDDHDRPVRVMGTLQDITARKKAELSLEQRVAQLALLNDIGGQIAAVLNLDSVLHRTVRLVQENFGYHHVALFTLESERRHAAYESQSRDAMRIFSPKATGSSLTRVWSAGWPVTTKRW